MKIIIAEDDPMISEIYKKKFSEAGYEVVCADSGDQVLTISKKENPDAVLLDLLLPKMDGYEVIENLRNGGYDSKIKIIVFSNLSQLEDREKALKMGADAFVPKSEYNPSDLVKEVSRILNQFNEEVKNELKNGSNNGEHLENGSGSKILMIEDEEVFLEMFGGKLIQEGYDVTFSSNGALGLKEAIKGNFDLIIVDMVLPGMGGDEIIARLKLEDKKKDVPIIVLSASVEKDEEKKVIELGANAFFSKTQLVPSELVSQVEKYVRKSEK
jgi:two-component system, cell cycle response regulator